MLSEVLLAAAFQIGPFYEQKPDAAALRPLWATEGQTTDVAWPLFTSHRDWWRFAFFTHWQSNDKGYQFDLMPLFWCGTQQEESYWGLFPLYGRHPHVLLLHDIDFALWPLWMSYSMPQARTRDAARTGDTEPLAQMRTRAVLWPFFHWRDDGSWGFWPLYVCNRQRESFHQTALWPLFTWASYEADRDTAGAGSSWMFWPLFGKVSREREDQWLFLPPLFSVAKTRPARELQTNDVADVRYRLPWPLFEYESTSRRDRLSIFPFYEKTTLRPYAPQDVENPVVLASREHVENSTCHRFGWKLVELYPDETRVFPFWVSRKDDSYFRLWPFWESSRGEDGVTRARFLSLFPIRNVPAVDRNWAKFWTFYEQASDPIGTDHSLFWGIIRWRTTDD